MVFIGDIKDHTNVKYGCMMVGYICIGCIYN